MEMFLVLLRLDMTIDVPWLSWYCNTIHTEPSGECGMIVGVMARLPN